MAHKVITKHYRNSQWKNVETIARRAEVFYRALLAKMVPCDIGLRIERRSERF
jgi:hypothetical protein